MTTNNKANEAYEDLNDPDYENETIRSSSVSSLSSLDEPNSRNNGARKRKKRQQVDNKTWCKNANKRRREKGEQYFGKKKLMEPGIIK